MLLSTSTTDRGQANTDRGSSQHGIGTAGDRPDTLRVLGEFELVVNARVADPTASCQRLLILLAIKGGQIGRASAAGILWPEATVPRASANLRSVLWKLQRCCDDVVEASFQVVRLAPDLCVDLQEAGRVARGLLDRSVTRTPGVLSEALSCNLYDDIVPDLDGGDWLSGEREQHRELRLHALEALGEDLIAIGWYGAAVEKAQGVIRTDPFRESARSLLVRAFLGEGNQCEARRQYREYCSLMRDELGLEPTDRFLKLGQAVDSACSPPGRAVPVPVPVPRRQPAQVL